MIKSEPVIDRDQLRAKIQKAEAAAAEVDKLTALQREAAELPDLIAAQNLEIARHQTAAQLAQVKANVQAKMDKVKADILTWRGKYAEMEKQIETLAADLDAIQNTIFGSFHQLEMAVGADFAANANKALFDPTFSRLGQPMADPFSAWAQITGGDANLRTISRFDSDLAGVIAGTCRAGLYVSAEELRHIKSIMGL